MAPPVHVQMPIDLACFLWAARLAPGIDRSFSLKDVKDIEAAWQVDDMDHASFGWVVVLRDGRRLYIEYTMEDAEAGRPEDLNLVALAAGQVLPDFDDTVDRYWYKPEHINQHLGLGGTGAPQR
jgi:hypothetical protein